MQKISTTYYLERKEIVAVDSNGDDVLDWVRVSGSEQSVPFDISGKSSWRQIRKVEIHILVDDIPFPDCAGDCGIIKVLGAGECEFVCPDKFKK